jgi:hypothetical protein
MTNHIQQLERIKISYECGDWHSECESLSVAIESLKLIKSLKQEVEEYVRKICINCYYNQEECEKCLSCPTKLKYTLLQKCEDLIGE